MRTQRRLRKSDLDALIGLYAQVSTAGRIGHGVIASAGHGTFGGLFIEFEDGDSIGWNPEDSATITIVIDPV